MKQSTFLEIRALFKKLDRANYDNAQSDSGRDVRVREKHYQRELERIIAGQGCLCSIAGREENETTL